MISDFLIKCSGADKSVLSECSESERTKFVGIGATILLTAILAGISGGYAIFFTFNSFTISLLFSILWFFTIFNLDRYIVSSIRKQGVFLKEVYLSLPRVLISIILAITISKPIELKLFDGSISKTMGEIEDQYNKKSTTDFNNQLSDLKLSSDALQKEMDKTKNELFISDPIVKEFKNQQGVLSFEANSLSDIISNNKTIISANTTYKSVTLPDKTVKRVKVLNKEAQKRISDNIGFSEEVNIKDNKISALNDSIVFRKSILSGQIRVKENQCVAQINSIQKRISELNNNRSFIIEKAKHDAAQDKDLLSRLKALSKLTSENSTAWWSSFLITLLFILIEISPIIVKLLSKRGIYDAILDRLEAEGFIKQDVILKEKKDSVEKYIQSFQELNTIRADFRSKSEKARTEAEFKGVNFTYNEILQKQMDIARIEVKKWYDAELSRLGVSLKKKNKRKNLIYRNQ